MLYCEIPLETKKCSYPFMFFSSVCMKNLMLELKNYEENQKAARMDRPSGLGELDQQQMGIIPVSILYLCLSLM